ncbi:hypothetical protein V3C99_011851, partial [Haemonchus contortus]
IIPSSGISGLTHSERLGAVRPTRSRSNRRMYVSPYRDKSDVINLIRQSSETPPSDDYETKRLFLNQLLSYILETRQESLNDATLFEELCLLLVRILRDNHACIRAMCFRLLRLCLFTERNLVCILTSQADVYTVRALDLQVENDEEREEALQLIFKMMVIYQQSHLKRLIEFSAAQQEGKKYAFPKSIMQPVIALALRTVCPRKGKDSTNPYEKTCGGENATDGLSMACFEVFLEFCVLEPDLILKMAGTDWMVRILTGDSTVSQRVAAVVARILVAWLDQPTLRAKGKLHLVLEQIFAPLIEFGFFQKNLASTEQGERIVDSAMHNFSISFLCILRTWSGLLSCAAIGPNSKLISSSPFRLLEYLGLGTVDDNNLARIREMIVDICCDFLNLPYASMKFENWDHALEYYSSITVPDEFSYSLKDDFVLAQSEMCIAMDEELARHVDLLRCFRSLAGFILINAGLLQSLARLIVAQPDSSSGLKATLFVTDVVRTASAVMPSGWRATLLSMPTLVQSACETLAQSMAAAAIHGYYDPNQTDRFTFPHSWNAAMLLNRFDMLNKAWIGNSLSGPAVDSHYSLFLCPPKALSLPGRCFSDESSLQPLIDETLSGDDNGINWEAAAILLAHISDGNRDLRMEAIWGVLDKIMTALWPRNGAHKRWKQCRFPIVVARSAITLGLELANEDEKFLQIFTRYATECCSALSERKSSTDLFSVKNLVDSGSMFYFCLIGTMSAHPNGVMALEKSGILQTFVDFMVPSTNAAYVKLIVSCLDYEFDHCYLSKVILQKALTSTCETARRWCTRFLSTLAYRRLPNFSDWGFRLLLGQLGDQSVKVIRHAIRVLHTWLPVYQDAARWLRTAQLDSFGEAGTLLKVHIYADSQLCVLDEEGTREAITLWMESFNERYVEVIDDEMRDSLLTVRRTISGTFSRTSGERVENHGLRVPAHLFGSLSRHEFGRGLIVELKVIDTLIDALSNEQEPKKVKAALMALGHIGSNDEGFQLLPIGVVPQMVRMAEEAAVLSVRGYAFWAVNILSSSLCGAEALARFGWESNHHSYMVDERLKKDDDQLERRSTPSTAPQIIVRGPRSESDARSVSPSSRCRSTSLAVTTSPSVARRVEPRLRRTRSATAVHLANHNRRTSTKGSDDATPRHERAVTGDSMFTSGLGSLSEDSATADGRRATTLDSLVMEWESRSRMSTIVYCLNQGFVANRNQLVVQGTVADMVRDPHVANAAREKWRLLPFKTKRFLEVNRSFGDPERYVYMTPEEELSLSRYRREMLGDPWLFDELRRFRTEGTYVPQRVSYIIALPSDVEVMCLNIFPSRSGADQSLAIHPSDVDNELEDRGARSGHSRSQRSDASITHSTFRCFYCSSETKEDFVLPQRDDLSQLRQEVLDQVDMLEIQQSTPEKKLLMLRSSYPWLFEWPCLYADVLELLDEYRFKSKSRAFLQEIFYNALKI